MASSTPAGFYDDGSGRLRYWDGAAWTEQFQDQVPGNPHGAALADAKAEQKAIAAQAKAERKAANDAAKAAKRAEAARNREAREAQKLADRAAFQQLAGNLVQRAPFGGKTVEIYENGFVRVGGLFSAANAPLEELRSISYRDNSRDKSSGGRALGAMATGGLNLLASKEKIQAYLSIGTDKQVYQLSSSQSMASEQKAAMSLEAAGRAVLDAKRHSELVAPTAVQPASPPAPPAQKSVAEQIRELAALHSEGILSDEEFTAAKNRLLM